VQAALGPIQKGADVEVHFVRRGAAKTAVAKKTEEAAADESPKAGLAPRRPSGRETIR
jgi:hypothetical protein